jgi:hypothetical protein
MGECTIVYRTHIKKHNCNPVCVDFELDTGYYQMECASLGGTSERTLECAYLGGTQVYYELAKRMKSLSNFERNQQFSLNPLLFGPCPPFCHVLTHLF